MVKVYEESIYQKALFHFFVVKKYTYKSFIF